MNLQIATTRWVGVRLADLPPTRRSNFKGGTRIRYATDEEVAAGAWNHIAHFADDDGVIVVSRPMVIEEPTAGVAAA